ncbi:MAG TPA: hypothetical protein PLE19_12710 [Planctomycetota bacterium]|nr:hypothetical protein [Planctomycetota bacterium]HRT95524.1 hypothetical protein [Planctomycetota bacterium]
MALTPTGLIAKPLDLVCDLFAAIPAFQRWTGHENDATGAKTHTHIEDAELDPETGVAEVPHVIVLLGDRMEGDSEQGGSGARNHFVHKWEVGLQVKAAISAEYKDVPRDMFLEFANALGAVLAGMELLAGTGGMPNIVGWRALGPAGRADHRGVGSPEGDFMMQEFALSLAEAR